MLDNKPFVASAKNNNLLRQVAVFTLLLCFAGFYLSLFLPVRLKFVERVLLFSVLPLLLALPWRDIKSFHRSLALNVFCFLLTYLFLSHLWSQSTNAEPARLLRYVGDLYVYAMGLHLIISRKIFAKYLPYAWLVGTALILAATLCSFYGQHPFSARLVGYGRMFNPNAIAMLSAGSFAMVLANFGNGTRTEKAILLLTGSIFLLSIVFSHSRSGLMALIVTSAIAIILNRERKMMALLIALPLFIIAVTGLDIWTERGTSFRGDIWLINWQRLQECGLLFGCGVGTDSGAIIDQTPVVHIHSIPFGLLFYGGLIAFIPYIALIAYALFAAFRQSTRNSAGFLLIAGCIGTLFNRYHLLMPPDYIWVALIGPLIVILSREINLRHPNKSELAGQAS